MIDIEFNVVNTDLSSSTEYPYWCCMAFDYPLVENGDLTLIDPDEVVCFNKEIKIHIDYPFGVDETFSFTSDCGWTRLRMLEAIFDAYSTMFGMFLFSENIGFLFLEGATISPDGNVELSIGT